jgi:hypothetical protein
MTVAGMLTDEERAAVLALTEAVDSVELKLTMLLSDRGRAGAALGVVQAQQGAE